MGTFVIAEANLSNYKSGSPHERSPNPSDISPPDGETFEIHF